MKKVSIKTGEKIDLGFGIIFFGAIFFIRFILKSEAFLVPMGIILALWLSTFFFRVKKERDRENESFSFLYLQTGIFFVFFQFISKSTVIWLAIGAMIVMGFMIYFIQTEKLTLKRKLSSVGSFFAIMISLTLFIIAPYIVESVQKMVTGPWVGYFSIDNNYYENPMNQDASITELYHVLRSINKPTTATEIMLKDETGKEYGYKLDEGNSRDLYFDTIEGEHETYKVWIFRGDVFGDASMKNKTYGYVQSEDGEPLHEIPEKWAKWILIKNKVG